MEVEERDKNAGLLDTVVQESSSTVSSVKITCSWEEAKNSVSAAFTFLNVNRKEKEVVNEDIGVCVEPDSCVLLKQREGTEEPLWIQLETTDPVLTLTKVHILSEASYIEVYGLFGEYIKTVTGELLEEVDSTMVFSCPIDHINFTQLRLKFVGLKGAKEVWLFGGCVWIERNETQCKSGGGRINMTAVNSRLGQGNCQLSPSADSLKRLVADYLERNQDMGATSLPLHMFQLPKPMQPSHSVDFIKTYIDSSLKNMENRLMDNLTEQMRELELRQNKRLDHILKLLESSSVASTAPNPNN